MSHKQAHQAKSDFRMAQVSRMKSEDLDWLAQLTRDNLPPVESPQGDTPEERLLRSLQEVKREKNCSFALGERRR